MRNLILAMVLLFTGFWAAAQSRYPNELEHLKLYDRYLAPLNPGNSTTSEVKQILGRRPDPDWRVTPLFSCVGDAVTCSHGGPGSETLFLIELHPIKKVKMQDIRFSSAFKEAYGSVSEINVQCKVYGDRSGLQYWILAEDSKYGKEGDLYQIIYGMAK